jgi:4-hydroxymandelate oxidase
MIPDAAELERRARELLPAAVYDFYAGGSGTERTLRGNEQAWQQVWLAPRVLRDVSSVELSVDLLGSTLPAPVGVAPMAFHGLAHPDGELASAAGAARAGALFVLSARSSRPIEDVGAAIADEGGRWWFQSYLMRDRKLTASMVSRAVRAGASAIVLTADTPYVGHKRRDRGNDVVTEPEFLVNIGPLSDLGAAEQAPDVSFPDIGWLAELSGGLPVVVKGVLRADDAKACLAAGAAAVIVSNHGGRQLDGALPSARALPAVAAAVHPAPACVDGGVRCAADMLAALALGARTVFVGRPVLWALATGGAAGVAEFLTGMTAGLAHLMALAGAASVAETAGLAVASDAAGPAATAPRTLVSQPVADAHTVEE